MTEGGGWSNSIPKPICPHVGYKANIVSYCPIVDIRKHDNMTKIIYIVMYLFMICGDYKLGGFIFIHLLSAQFNQFVW